MSLLSVHDLTKRFGGLVAVNHVSFDVAEGAVVGLIGPNGAGKTTIYNLVTGFIPPTAGSVTFQGKNLVGLAPHQVCALGLTRTFQIVQPFPEMTVLENVTVGAFSRYPSTAMAEKKASETLARIGLAHKGSTLAKSLTLLERKRLEIGKVLATEPKMLLLDEVAAGLNAVEITDVLELCRQLNREGITLLVVEHIMQVIMNLCQQIIVLHYGEKIAEGTPQEITHDPRVLEAYLGEEEMLA